jgi:V8-like Glu-specific endopeptidase
MADLPLTWEELRHREGAEASADVPEDMLGLVQEEEPPKREMRFLDRLDRPASYERGADERGADDARTLEGYRPPWLTSSYLPKRARTPIPRTVLHHDQRLEPAIVYPPDERTIYNDRSYPWGCICKVRTAAGFVGSGALIGPRHVLTASHCVDWGTDAAETIQVHLTGTTAAATAFDTLAYAFTQISGDPTVTTLDEDYACLVLDQRLGDVFGWLGTKTYDSSWDGDNVWWSMGYPTDIASGLQPTFIKNKNMDEDEWDYGSGRAMTTSADMMKGQSGSAMFGFWDEGNPPQPIPYAVAVMSAFGNVWASGFENWCSGGSDLGRVVKQARDENP